MTLKQRVVIVEDVGTGCSPNPHGVALKDFSEMQVKFVDYLPETATICKASVKTDSGFQSIKVIAVRTNYGNRDECKTWAQERGGSWHPVEKFWWVPASTENLQSLKNLSFFNGEFYAPHPQLREFIAAKFNDAPAPEIEEGTVYDERSVFPEQESDYMSGHTTLHGEDLPQMQGWVTVDGKAVRILILNQEPTITQFERDAQCEPRQYQRPDGSVVWCRPWEDPTDRMAMPMWPDGDVEGDIAPPNSDATVILELKAIVRDGDVIGARAYCQKGVSDYHWDVALNFCRKQPGRKWNADATAWDIPLTPEFAKNLERFCSIEDWQVKLSDRLNSELKAHDS